MKKITLTLLALLLPLQVFAGNTTYSFKMYPEFPNKTSPRDLYYELKPGQKIEDSLIVKNDTGEKVSLNVFGVDSKDGGDQFFKSDKATQEEVGTWIVPESNRIDLEENQQSKLKLSISVPEGTEKEKVYVGAIVYYRDSLSSSDSQIKSVYRYTIRTKIKVTDNPQPVEKLTPPAPPIPWTQIYFYISLGLFVLVALYFVGNAVKSAHHKRKHGHTKS